MWRGAVALAAKGVAVLLRRHFASASVGAVTVRAAAVAVRGAAAAAITIRHGGRDASAEVPVVRGATEDADVASRAGARLRCEERLAWLSAVGRLAPRWIERTVGKEMSRLCARPEGEAVGLLDFVWGKA